MYSQIFAFLLFFQCFISCQQEAKVVRSSAGGSGVQTAVASLKEQEPAATLASGLFLSDSMPTSTSCRQTPGTPAANIIFRSADGGQTWQDVSAGLPEDLQIGCVFTSGDKVFLGSEKGLHHSSTTAPSFAWQRDFSFDKGIEDLFHGQTGLIAHTYGNGLFQQVLGTGLWMPVFADLKDKIVCTMLETSDGTILAGCRNGMFKSADHGKTWKQVFDNGWVMKIVESDGVLICTNEHGILRSTDGGEQWNLVISEGGVGITAECIEGGFAAITYNTESQTRRVRISTDSGKTWQPIDAGLPPQASIASIKQVGEYFFCGHPDGIFRSADRGKTWQLVRPTIGKKVFNLSVSGKVIYAVPRDGGC